MGISSSKKKEENIQLKRIIFLISQKKELKNKEKDHIFEFYLINQSLDKYDKNFNIERIIQYLEENDEFDINNFENNYKNNITQFEKYCLYKKENKSKNEIIQSGEPNNNTKNNHFKNIDYPNNFFLIFLKFY